MSKPAIIVGHQASRPGAVNAAQRLTEFAFNSDLGEAIVAATGWHLVWRMPEGYAALPGKVNALDPSVAVELHCNSNAGLPASGVEMIHYPGSVRGSEIAERLSESVSTALGLPNRGAKPPWNNRGMRFLRGVKAPAIIAESFFINNNDDLAAAQDNFDALVQAYVTVLSSL